MGRRADVDDGGEPWMEAGAMCNMCCFFCSVLVMISVFGVLAFETGRPFTLGILLISVVPSFIVMFFAYWREDQHRLNFVTVTIVFMVGVIGTLAVVLFELVISRVVLDLPDDGAATGPSRALSFRILVAFANAFLVAALVEEVFKYVVTAVVTELRGLRDSYAIFVVGLSVAMGFAALENMGYLLSSPNKLDDGEVLGIGIARGLMSVPIHAATGSLIGVGIARNTHGEDWPVWRVRAPPAAGQRAGPPDPAGHRAHTRPHPRPAPTRRRWACHTFFTASTILSLWAPKPSSARCTSAAAGRAPPRRPYPFRGAQTASGVGVTVALLIVMGISWYAVRQVRQLMEDSRTQAWHPLPANQRHQVC